MALSYFFDELMSNLLLEGKLPGNYVLMKDQLDGRQIKNDAFVVW